MEREIEVSGGLFRLLYIALRVGTVVSARYIKPHDSIAATEILPVQVLAVTLISVSTATIGIIENNDLEAMRDSSAGRDLQNLIKQSLGTAVSLIVLGVGVLIAESVVIAFAVINFQPLKLVRKVLVSGILCF